MLETVENTVNEIIEAADYETIGEIPIAAMLPFFILANSV